MKLEVTLGDKNDSSIPFPPLLPAPRKISESRPLVWAEDRENYYFVSLCRGDEKLRGALSLSRVPKEKKGEAEVILPFRDAFASAFEAAGGLQIWATKPGVVVRGGASLILLEKKRLAPLAQIHVPPFEGFLLGETIAFPLSVKEGDWWERNFVLFFSPGEKKTDFSSAAGLSFFQQGKISSAPLFAEREGQLWAFAAGAAERTGNLLVKVSVFDERGVRVGGGCSEFDFALLPGEGFSLEMISSGLLARSTRRSAVVLRLKAAGK